MLIPAPVRRLLWRRRIAEARAWQTAARAEAAQHNAAIRRILDQAAQMPDPIRGRRD